MTLPTILIDSREKKPWSLEGYRTKKSNLTKYGCDYTLYGYSSLIGVERKSLIDFVNSNGPANRKRFHASLNKLKKLKKHVIIVEGDPSQYRFISKMKKQPWRPEWIASNAVFLATKGIYTVFCSSRSCAEETAINFFYYAKDDIDKLGMKDEDDDIDHQEITEIN